MKVTDLTIIVPCYNEELVLPIANRELNTCLLDMIEKGLIAESSSILYVDDGSKDNTWHIIKELKKENKHIRGLKLSRNYGHQNALLAGLAEAKSGITVSIDADLQDDILAIKEMVIKYNNGYDIVYGVRNDRESDSAFKRLTANTYYSLLAKMGVDQIHNHADFRLLSARAVEALMEYNESEIYIRGLIPQIGFKSECVYYKRAERKAGESKYPIKKMISLALKGITSNTVFPLRAIALSGITIAIVSFIAFIVILLEKILGTTFPGWASICAGIFFLGGVQLFSVGIIGEYIGKIYMETKRRPRYFKDELI